MVCYPICRKEIATVVTTVLTVSGAVSDGVIKR